jgi:hypothetical protein
MNTRIGRFVLLGLFTLALLQAIGLWVLAMWPLVYLQPFLLFVGMAMAAKILGDAVYFITAPARRTWRYLDDYLINDLIVHARFAVPLACLQAWAANAYLVFFPEIRKLWITPALGVFIWAINRYLVEQAEDARHRPVGAGAARISTGRQ